MPVPNLPVAFHLTFFLQSAYADGVPMLRYSVPVVKAAIDGVKVYRLNSSVSSLITDFDLCDVDLG